MIYCKHLKNQNRVGKRYQYLDDTGTPGTYPRTTATAGWWTGDRRSRLGACQHREAAQSRQYAVETRLPGRITAHADVAAIRLDEESEGERDRRPDYRQNPQSQSCRRVRSHSHLPRSGMGGPHPLSRRRRLLDEVERGLPRGRPVPVCLEPLPVPKLRKSSSCSRATAAIIACCLPLARALVRAPTPPSLSSVNGGGGPPREDMETCTVAASEA